MKIPYLFVVLAGVVLPIGAQTINIATKPLPPLTAKTVNADLVRRACMLALQREETATKRIQVLDVSVVPTKDERTPACVVSAKVMEGAGAYIPNGTVQITDVRYSGSVNLETSKVELARIDEDAAKQVALNALASMFIDLKLSAMATDRIAYTALIAGKKCVIEVSNDASPEPKRWLVTKLDCKR